MQPSIVIIGLGNPGDAYLRTRHNAGFRAIDALGEAFGTGEERQQLRFRAVTREARIVTVPVLLMKPQTYMNGSGDAVQKILQFYKLDPARQILVLSDDIDLPLGELRLRAQGGPGTHNGLRSIHERIGEGFPRLRIGVGKPTGSEDLAAWVLSTPSPDEERTLQESIIAIPEMVRAYVVEGKH